MRRQVIILSPEEEKRLEMSSTTVIFSDAASTSNINDGIAEYNLFNMKRSIFRRKYTLIYLLVTVIILLILLTITIIQLIKVIVNRPLPECNSNECLQVSSDLRISMDQSIHPCEDFYEYTCKKWSMDHNNYPNSFPHFSNFAKHQERIVLVLIDFLGTDVIKHEPLPVKQSKELYKSCMDEHSINETTHSTIIKYLESVNLPPLPKMLTAEVSGNHKFDWVKAEVDIKKMFNMDVFLGFEIVPNGYDRKENLMVLSPPSKQSPLINRKAPRMNLEELYKQDARYIIQSMLQYLYKPVIEPTVETAVDILWMMKERLTGLSRRYYFPNNKLKRSKVQHLDELTNKHLRQFDVKISEAKNVWTKYLTLLFKNVPKVSLDLEERDFIYYYPLEEDTLIDIIRYLFESSNINLELYAWYHMVYPMFISQYSQILSGHRLTVLERAKKCVSFVDEHLTYAVSYGIADKLFLNTTKPKIERMLVNTKKALVNRILNMSWMDIETKDSALDKISEIITHMEYPDWLFDKSKLELYYEDIVIKSNTHLENMISIIRRYTSGQLGNLRKKMQKDQISYLDSPIYPNAYQYREEDFLHIPVSILSLPFYHLGLEALHYGAIGTAIGHHLIRGLYEEGKYEKCDNCAQNWTNQTIKIFEQKSQCFAYQYKQFTKPKQQINGNLTLKESIADTSGVKLAHIAYKNFVHEYGTEDLLPGLKNYTHNQLFFLAYAHRHCGLQPRESFIDQVIVHKYAPDSLRVLGTLRNMEEFAIAFDCPLGSNMNPHRERCEIW